LRVAFEDTIQRKDRVCLETWGDTQIPIFFATIKAAVTLMVSACSSLIIISSRIV
jgi:hypothetical protein